MSFIIRNAKIDDALQIAEVHCKSWQSTYKGIISDDYLRKIQDDFDNGSSTKRRADFIQEFNGVGTFVAEINGQIVGFCEGGKAKEEANQNKAEIYAFYILKEFRRQHLGRRLFNAFVREYVLKNNFTSLLIRTLEKTQSKKFYSGMGGKLINDCEEDICGGRHRSLYYLWQFKEPAVLQEDI